MRWAIAQIRRFEVSRMIGPFALRGHCGLARPSRRCGRNVPINVRGNRYFYCGQVSVNHFRSTHLYNSTICICLVDNKMPDLNLIRALVEVIDAGKMSEAARRRGVTRSYISKEIKQLEHEIGVTLIRRTTRSLEPTAQGQTLYEHGVRMLAEMDSAQAAIDSLTHEVRGHLRLSIPTALGHFVLEQHLFAFLRQHPAVTLNVMLSNRVFDLMASQVDVAVRISSEAPLDSVARELCPVRWGLYAAHELHGQLQNIADPHDLERIPFICLSGPPPLFVLRLSKGKLRKEIRLKPRIQSENVPLLHAALCQGLGVALLPEYSVTSELKSGAVKPVLPDWIPEGLGGKLYILSMPNRQPTGATQALIAHLRDVLASL